MKMFDSPRRRRGRIQLVYSGPVASAITLPDLGEIFGADLAHLYTSASLWKDAGKTAQATVAGDQISVWADLVGSLDLKTTIESFISNGMPGPLVYQDKLNNYPVFGSGWIYDGTTGAQVTQSGNPGVNGTFNGFFDGNIDSAEDTYVVFTVCKDLIADMQLFELQDASTNEYRSLYAQDHHPVTGSILQNITGGGTQIQAYQGPDGNNFWHSDGVWRVIATSLSWTRTNNALWVNGTKYSVGTGLPIRSTVDTGAGADTLVPADPNHLILMPDAVPTAQLAIVRGVQTDEKILAAVRYLGQKFGITVA